MIIYSFMKLIYSNSCSRQICEQDVQGSVRASTAAPSNNTGTVAYMRERVLCTDQRQIKATKIILILMLMLIYNDIDIDININIKSVFIHSTYNSC